VTPMSAIVPGTVADNELLYRRIPARFVQILPNGTLRATSQAFADRVFETSVNRAVLCQHRPESIRNDPSDGVASFIAADVRCFLEQRDARGAVIGSCGVDVLPAPERENAAHAVIVILPPCPPDKLFRKLCSRLALLAEQRDWEIVPQLSQ
jgi:hypothetical protein